MTSLAAFADLMHAPRVLPLLLTTDEVATMLALSERQVKRLIGSGALPSVVVGTSRRVRAVDVAAYVDNLAGHSFREKVETNIAPPAGVEGRRSAGGGACAPVRASASLPQDAA